MDHTLLVELCQVQQHGSLATGEQRAAFLCFTGGNTLTFTIQVTARFIRDYVTEFEKHMRLETSALLPILHVDFYALFV